MHMMKKCGGTPCDRRLDRRKVAIAAAAVLLLFVTSAQAGITDMVLNEQLSQLTVGGSVTVPGVGTLPVVKQAVDFSGKGAIGDVAHYAGHQYVDIQAATVQLMPYGKGYVVATGSAPGGPPYSQGAWIPWQPDPSQDPTGSVGNPAFGGAPADYGNYGVQVTNIGAYVRYLGIQVSPSGALLPNGPRAMAGPAGNQQFSVAPEMWTFAYGWEDFVSSLGGDHNNLVGFPMPLGGALDIRPYQATGNPALATFAPNATVGVWDSINKVLTVNVNGSVRYTIDDGGTPGVFTDDIEAVQSLVGKFVMSPVVPEPSSMVLAGFGVVGLLSYVWRARRRRPAAPEVIA